MKNLPVFQPERKHTSEFRLRVLHGFPSSSPMPSTERSPQLFRAYADSDFSPLSTSNRISLSIPGS
jgi:hypothetical protein